MSSPISKSRRRLTSDSLEMVKRRFYICSRDIKWENKLNGSFKRQVNEQSYIIAIASKRNYFNLLQ